MLVKTLIFFCFPKKTVYKMVPVLIENTIYDIPNTWLQGSKFIQDLRELNLDSMDQAIPLPFSTHAWNAYLHFLETGVPNDISLQVIDYLDNEQQLNQWVSAELKSGRPLHLLEPLFKNTNYQFPLDIDPHIVLNGDICNVDYIQDKQLFPNYIEYIFKTFIPNGEHLYNVYTLTSKYRDINTIPEIFLKTLLDTGLILVSSDKQDIYYERNKMLTEGVSNLYPCYYGDDRITPRLISNDIIGLFKPTGQYSISQYEDRYWSCPKSDPYLHVKTSQGTIPNPYKGLRYEESNRTLSIPNMRHMCCGGPNPINPDDVVIPPITLPVQKQHTRYQPITICQPKYNLKLKVEHHNIESYTLPSLYNRNYYVYVIFAYSPQTLTVFSV
jgi:hypothetical protein